MRDEATIADLERRREAERIAAELTRLDGSNDPFAAAVRATRMPMIVTNPRLPDNPTVFVNDAFCRLTGYPRAEIIGRNCRFLQGPDTDRAAVARLREAVLGQRAIEIDIRNHRRNGEAFWNRLLLAPVHDIAGNLIYFFGSQVDVTLERERLINLERNNVALLAEIAGRSRMLEQSEERLRLALEAGALGAWEIDLLHDMWHCSARFFEILGHVAPPRGWSYADLLRQVVDDDRSAAEAELRSALQAGDVWRIRCRIRRADTGAIRWIDLNGLPVAEPDGAVARMAGTIADVTDRERAAMELREANQELRTRAGQSLRERDRIWRASPDLLLVCDTDGWFRAVNPAWTTILGYEESELVGHRYTEFVHPDDIADTAVAVARAAASTNRYLHKDGSLRWFAWTAASEDGLIYAIGRHVTAEREAAESLRAAEEQLRQAQKMEAVGQLTGGIAHDFNNLLTGIGGSLEMLETRIEQGRAPEALRYIAAARAAADRAASLTHRLLAFSRRQTLDPRPVRVGKLVAGLEELIARAIGPSVELVFSQSLDLWTTRCDPHQLENALLNLCINARDAMPDGGRLTVETDNATIGENDTPTHDMTPGEYVSVSVSDTGIGMSPDIVARAFDPFFTTKPIGEGTGLGLSMTYGFVRQSGGQARIYSEPGHGTSVKLYLPRHVGADIEQPAYVAPPTASDDRIEATVLVLDDEEVVRTLVADGLEAIGLTTMLARDSAAALDILRSDIAIDLLITDIGLPGPLNGTQLVEAARASRPALRILFITGYAANAAGALMAPGTQVVTKPFSMRTLVKRVRAILTT